MASNMFNPELNSSAITSGLLGLGVGYVCTRATRENVIRTKDAEIEKFKNDIKARDAEIEKLENDGKAREAEMAKKIKDQNKHIENNDFIIKEQEEVIAKRDLTIKQLEEKVKGMDSIMREQERKIEEQTKENMAEERKSKHKRLLYLGEGVVLPPEVQQLLPRKLKELENHEHPLLLKTLRQIRTTERIFYDVDTIMSCILAHELAREVDANYSKEVLCELEEILRGVLEKEPDNLVVLSIKYNMKKTKTTKERIQALASNSLCLHHAFAVLAFYLYKLKVIRASVKLFELAIGAWEQSGKGEDVKVVVWKYLLAAAYSELCDREEFIKDLEGFDPEVTMCRVKELLLSVIEYGRQHDNRALRMLAARSYTDLGCTFAKYQLIGNQDERLVGLDGGMTVKDCYDRGNSLCGCEDPHILERFGIFRKKTAHTQKLLVQCADSFEHVLRLSPGRHVAAHHLALTYKALWAFDENLQQKHIYQNKVKAGKTGKRDSRPKHAKKPNQQRSPNMAGQCDFSESDPKGATNSNAVKEAVGLTTTKKKCDDGSGLIYPKKQTNQRQVPQHWDDPDYQDSLKAANPKAKRPTSRYLLLAKKYLEKAVEITEGLRAIYLIDLARVHISCGENDAALQRFRNAKLSLGRNPAPPNCAITAYLYEQWAMFMQVQAEEHSNTDVITSEGSDSEESEERLNSTECYFIKSIRSAISIKSKSRLAYYKLRDMLEKTLEREPSSPKWMVLCEVYQLVGQHNDAQRLLENHEKTAPQARKLYKQQSLQEQQFGEFVDFAFVISSTNRPDDQLRHDIIEMTMYKLRHAVEQNSDDVEAFKDLGDAMKLALYGSAAQDEASPSTHPQNRPSDSVLVFMARNECDDSDSSAFNYIMDTLEMCGLLIKRYFKNNLDDFDPGSRVFNEIEETIIKCQLILVSDVRDTYNGDEYGPSMSHIVKTSQAAKLGERRLFILQETDDTEHEEWKTLPHITIRGENNKTMFYNFVLKMFQSICPPNCSYCTHSLKKVRYIV